MGWTGLVSMGQCSIASVHRSSDFNRSVSSRPGLGRKSRRPRVASSEHGGREEKGRAAEDWVSSPSATPYEILGVDPNCCSLASLKSAFRTRVKEFHPDVCKNMRDPGAIVQRVIQAYEILSKRLDAGPTERACFDPFEEPECEAYDLFINEILCVGKACPYPCVERAPHAFSFTSENGTARVMSQGNGADYLIQLAVGQCPRRCIHYVTPSQREVLEDLLNSAFNPPFDPADEALLDSLISKAKFENNRYQKPKRQSKSSTKYVDWF